MYTFVPLGILVALTYLATRIDLRVHPSWAARTLAVLCLTTLLALAASVALTIAGLVTRLMPADFMRSHPILQAIAAHGTVNIVLGSAILVLALLAVARLGIASWRMKRYDQEMPRSSVVSDDEPFAVAVPSDGGRIVISTGLREILSADELAVVYRHEESHLARKHHIYVGLAKALALVFPPLARAEGAMRLAVERWADEDAVLHVGSRQLVAATLGKVALSRSGLGAGPHLAVANHDVVYRIQALLNQPGNTSTLRGSAVLSGSGVVAGGLASSPLQLHHLLLAL